MLTSAAFVTPTKPANLHAFRLLKGTRIKAKRKFVLYNLNIFIVLDCACQQDPCTTCSYQKTNI